MRRRSLILLLALSASAQNPSTTVTVDASANRHAINPNIYGVAFGDSTTLPDLNCPVNRYGGDNASRYNWQINADNRGSDWYFESIGDDSSTAGERGDTFFTTSRNAGAQAMITVPLIGWVAKLGSNRNKLASFSIAKYGAQTGSDSQWYPDAGDGTLSSNGQFVTGNDPNDANVASDSTFQQGWIQHFVTTFGKAVNGGVGYYLLDNESSIWFSTHRDVHPAGPTMDEMKTRILDYAAKIKAVDPTAKIAGPEEWGWDGYFYSGYDQQYGSLHNWSSYPDRASHGNQDYLPWLLSQLYQNAISTGQRLLDLFSVHYYPQGGEFGNDTSTAMQQRRNRSTRSLWDPNYVDETWINDKVYLIPRLKSWVSTYYFSGTPVGLTEYNWGAESHINGATTQADILGIFGREGLDLATRWTTPDPSTPTYKAMKIYRNYDGLKSGFGDTSVSAAVANPDQLSSFAALRASDGALTVMVINKVLSGSTPVAVGLNNFSGNGLAHVYQLTSANAIQHLSDISYTGAALNLTAPPQSITLLVLPKSAVVLTPALSIAKTHSGNFAQGQHNAAYQVTVSNGAGAGPTSGQVTVTETLPAGLTLVSMSGTGWTCSANSCTRSDVLNAGASYPAITATVNVALNASSPQVNSVSVAGGGSAGANTTDSTVITSLTPSLSVHKSHIGSFRRSQQNAGYSVVVSNALNAGATTGIVTVTETLPAGLTLVSMSGSGWTCASNSCTRSDALNPGSSYPAIAVSVNVASNAPLQVTNHVAVSGGGSAAAIADDLTGISQRRLHADFDNNGVADLVWQDDATGQVTIHYYGGVGGNTYQTWNWLQSSSVPGWHVAAVADFNGDDFPDLVWQNDTTRQVTVHYYGGAGGASLLGWNWLNEAGAPGWKVVAAADFNQDGVPDLVWQNDSTRQVTVHYYGGSGGAVLQSWGWLQQANVPGWHVAAAADFNLDGSPDLVWLNDTTRQVTVHYYGGAGGATFLNWNWLNNTGATGWTVKGAVDINGDGFSDLVWQNDSTRQVTAHYYGGAGGASYQNWAWLDSAGSAGWSVAY